MKFYYLDKIEQRFCCKCQEVTDQKVGETLGHGSIKIQLCLKCWQFAQADGQPIDLGA